MRRSLGASRLCDSQSSWVSDAPSTETPKLAPLEKRLPCARACEDQYEITLVNAGRFSFPSIGSVSLQSIIVVVIYRIQNVGVPRQLVYRARSRTKANIAAMALTGFDPTNSTPISHTGPSSSLGMLKCSGAEGSDGTVTHSQIKMLTSVRMAYSGSWPSGFARMRIRPS